MSNPGDGGDIIIKGGSVDLDYDQLIYPQDPVQQRSHKNLAKKITRVQITGDITFDSNEVKEGLTCTITVTCE